MDPASGLSNPASAWESATESGEAARENSKHQRDLYLEMKRLENPDFSSIPEPELRAAVNTSSPPMTTTAISNTEREPYVCNTQQVGSIDALFIGVGRGTVVLWESGSVLHWTARLDGYPRREMALEAALAMWHAAQQWNAALDGRVRFKYVTRFDDACFMLTYGGDRRNVLASAFFPDQFENSLNVVRVYAGQWVGGRRRCFVSTMLHELGHVIGMRHEHAHNGVPGWIPPEDRANGPESIVWGTRNPRSAMAYYGGMGIQESDVVAIKRAYDELEDGAVIVGQGKFGFVHKTMRRVKPNN